MQDGLVTDQELTGLSCLARARQARDHPVRNLREESWLHHEPHLLSVTHFWSQSLWANLEVNKLKQCVMWKERGSGMVLPSKVPGQVQFPCVDPDTHATGP